MDTDTNILDPDGDMLIVLRNPDPPFAKWHKDIKKNWGDGEDEDVLTKKDEVKYLVSSKHLMLASRYFRTALSGPWKRDMNDNVRRWEVEGWDPSALLLVLQIIHGQTAAFDGYVSLERLAKVALVVDFYQCHGPVCTFAKTWMDKFWHRGYIPTIDRDLILSLFVSVVFGLGHEFYSCTRAIMEVATGPIPTLGLPIPQALVDTMEEARRTTITGDADAFKYAHRELSGGKHGCSPSCRLSLHRALFERADTRIINEKPWKHFTVKKADAMRKGIQPPYKVVYKGHKGPFFKARAGYHHGKQYSAGCDLEQVMLGGPWPIWLPKLKVEDFRRVDEEVGVEDSNGPFMD